MNLYYEVLEMSKKFINSIEYEFRLRFGCYPFDYYMQQLECGFSKDEAFQRLQKKIDLVWSDMQYTHSKKNTKTV